jgi:O-antigen/teichoic acid export membrane protein
MHPHPVGFRHNRATVFIICPKPTRKEMKIFDYGQRGRLMGLLNKYFLNLSAQVAGRIGTICANIAVFMMVARLGGTELFGQYSYILTYCAVVTTFADFGLTRVLAKDFIQVQETRELYWGNYLFLRGIIYVLVIIIATIAAYFIRNDLFPVLFVICMAIPFYVSRFYEPVFQVYDRPWFSTYSCLSYAITYPLLTLCGLMFSKSLMTLMWGYVIANGVYFVVVIYLSNIVVKPRFILDRKIIRKIMKLSLPLAVSSIFVIINSRIAVFMLAEMKTDYDVGIFNAAYRFLEWSALLISMLVNPLIPIFSLKAEQHPESLKEDFTRIFELLAVFGLPVAIVCPFISDFIVSSFYGYDFVASAAALNVLAWTGVLVLYSVFTSSLVLSIGVVHFGYWCTATASVMNIILNYHLIPQYSFVGSAWAALICEVFLAGVTILYALLHLGNFLRWTKWACIIAINLLLYGVLYHLLKEVTCFVIVAAMTVYVLSAFRLGLLSLNIISGFSDGRSAYQEDDG